MKLFSTFLFGALFLLFSCGNNQKHITKEDYGQDWPFSVKSGNVVCEGEEYMVVFKTNGDAYALNEAAKKSGKYRDIAEIIRPDANYPGRKIMMDLSAIEFEGLKLCDKR